MVKSKSVTSYGLGRRRIDLLFKDLFDTTTPKKWTMPNSGGAEDQIYTKMLSIKRILASILKRMLKGRKFTIQ